MMKTFILVLIVLFAFVQAFLGPSDYQCTDKVFTGSDNKSPCRCCSIDCNRILLFKKNFDNQFLEGVKKNKKPDLLTAQETTCKKRFYNYGCHLKSHCIRNVRFNEWLLGAAYCMMYNGCEVQPQFHSDSNAYNQTLFTIQSTLYPSPSSDKKIYTKEELESIALDYLNAEAAPIFFNFKQLQDVKESIYTFNFTYEQFLKSSMAKMPFKRVPAHVLNTLKARFPDKLYYESVKAAVDALVALNPQVPPQHTYLGIENSWKKVKDAIENSMDEINAQINTYVRCASQALPGQATIPPICFRNQRKADTLPNCDVLNNQNLLDCGVQMFDALRSYQFKVRILMKEVLAKTVYYGTPVDWVKFKRDNLPDPRGSDIDNESVVSMDPIKNVNGGSGSEQVIGENNVVAPSTPKRPRTVYVNNDGTIATAKPVIKRIKNWIKQAVKKLKSKKRSAKKSKKNQKKKSPATKPAKSSGRKQQANKSAKTSKNSKKTAKPTRSSARKTAKPARKITRL